MMEQISLMDIGVIPKEWQYDEDTGSVMCRCPICGGRLTIGLYTYRNPYKFCPYCGERLAEGRLTAKRKAVYGLAQEEEGRAACEQMKRLRS